MYSWKRMSEEKWYACYQLGHCYVRSNETEKAIYYFMMGFNYNPNRVENIYEVSKIYRERGIHHTSNFFINNGLAIINANKLQDCNTLFKVNHVYNYLLLYEKSIIAFYTGEHAEGRKVSNHLLLNKDRLHVQQGEYNIMWNNLKFYNQKFCDIGGKHVKIFTKENLILTPTELTNIKGFDNYKNIYNPSLVICQNKKYINLRCSNYHTDIIDGKLEYKVYKDNELLPIGSYEHPVSTINFLCSLNKDFQITESVLLNNSNDVFKYPSTVIGIEDIRLITVQDDIYCVGNARTVDQNNTPKMVLGKYD